MKRFKKPNKSLLRVLPFLQKEDEPVGTTEIANRIGESRDRVQLALLLLHDERIIEHSWSDERLKSKEGGREGMWLLRSMENTLITRGEW